MQAIVPKFPSQALASVSYVNVSQCLTQSVAFVQMVLEVHFRPAQRHDHGLCCNPCCHPDNQRQDQGLALRSNSMSCFLACSSLDLPIAMSILGFKVATIVEANCLMDTEDEVFPPPWNFIHTAPTLFCIFF